jgi:hypothetical protein
MPVEPLPPEDESPLADPFEAELVAYLDGELDPVAARRVEDRLAVDPAARARVSALKQTYDLLDYLPKPDPSPNFTTRTLDKLPALKSGSLLFPIPSDSMRSARPTASAGSMSGPLMLDGGPSPPKRPWLVAAGIVAAVLGFGAIGYLGAAALRPYLFPAKGENADALPLSDHRLIENLPLYALADDFEYVQKLAEPELFGAEVIPTAARKGPGAIDPDKPSRSVFESLAQSFKALPPARQQAIRELDRQLYAVDAESGDRLFRALEEYAVWLDRLPDPERRGILAAGTPGLRLGVIRDVRERQWFDALPAAQRGQLAGLSDVKKAEKIRQWKEEEARQRGLWTFVRKNAESMTGNKHPWPFDTETGRKEIIDYVRAAYRIEEPRHSRLTPFELAAYRESLPTAEKGGSWAWYGRGVYELSRKYEALPEPAEAKFRYDDFGNLPPGLNKLTERPNLKKRLASHAGKWPEFPLELHDELRSGKFGPAAFVSLGPAKVADFKEPVRKFWEKELAPKLTTAEKEGLQRLEKRWPEYPREFVRLARVHDLSVPGVMLPGSPARWDATYGSGLVRSTPPRP